MLDPSLRMCPRFHACPAPVAAPLPAQHPRPRGEPTPGSSSTGPSNTGYPVHPQIATGAAAAAPEAVRAAAGETGGPLGGPAGRTRWGDRGLLDEALFGRLSLGVPGAAPTPPDAATPGRHRGLSEPRQSRARAAGPRRAPSRLRGSSGTLAPERCVPRSLRVRARCPRPPHGEDRPRSRAGGRRGAEPKEGG